MEVHIYYNIVLQRNQVTLKNKLERRKNENGLKGKWFEGKDEGPLSEVEKEGGEKAMKKAETEKKMRDFLETNRRDSHQHQIYVYTFECILSMSVNKA